MKKIVYLILTIILTVPLSIQALEINGLHSKNVIIYNLDEDKIIYEKNSEEKASIASLTKIMTTLVSIEKIEDLDESVTITNEMLADVPWDASIAGISVGDTLTYRDLLYASMLPSGADATDSLAISLFGSINKMVEEMNKKAEDLELTNTHFVNTTGYDATGHYSTAKDILTLLKYALENETFKEIYTAKTYTTTNNLKFNSTIIDYNKKFDYDLSYILGSKTGFTDEAGQCLAALSNIDDTNIITITINASYISGSARHLVDMTKLHDTLIENYEKRTFIEEGETIKELPTKYAKEETVPINSLNTISRYIEKPYDESQLEIKYEGEEIITSTTKKGTEVGTLKIYYNGELIEEMKAITASDLNFSVWNYLKENILYYGGAILLIIITILILKPKKRKKRRRN